MKLLHVGFVLPNDVVRMINGCFSGNKFEISLIKALDKVTCGNVDVVSFSSVGRTQIKAHNIREIYDGKPFKHVFVLEKPIIGEVVRDVFFLFALMGWCVRNRAHKKTVLIINSPFGICLVALFAKFFGAKVVSFTIDTPFSGSCQFRGLIGLYQKTLYTLGHRILKFFSGMIVLNRAVMEKLQLRMPCLEVKIGFDEEDYDFQKRRSETGASGSHPYRIVYAGALSEYNGVITLANAAALMDQNKYEVHVYGKGPLEKQMRALAEATPTMIFHGFVDVDMQEVFASADLLINPRVTQSAVCDFTFPSKMTEYILSGCPVLTTDFSSMPEDYKAFVYLIKDETPEGLCRAIERVSQEDPCKLKEKCTAGVEYIRCNQNWSVIARAIYGFVGRL